VTKSSTKSSGTKTSASASKSAATKTARTQAPRGAAKAFTLEDVLGEIERSSKTRKTSSKSSATENKVVAPKKVLPEPKPKQQKYGAASLADILGYNPTKNEKPVDEIEQIPKKYLRFYKLLIQLRDHVNSGLTLHSEDTLKRSNREDSGDLSGYGQHMADAGTDNFDRDFALSLVSNEQEALYEIQEAIQRIKKGTYGICETSGKAIPKERLLAVPFARYSVESQTDIEKHRRFTAQRAGVFAEATGDEGKFLEDNSD
jgi:RNA polymerase-binding transcription factor DksA